MDNNKRLLSVKDLNILSLDQAIDLYKKGYKLEEEYKLNHLSITLPLIGRIFKSIKGFAHFGLGTVHCCWF